MARAKAPVGAALAPSTRPHPEATQLMKTSSSSKPSKEIQSKEIQEPHKLFSLDDQEQVKLLTWNNGKALALTWAPSEFVPRGINFRHWGINE